MSLVYYFFRTQCILTYLVLTCIQRQITSRAFK